MLSPKDVNSLEVPFKEEEIFAALKEMNGDKGPSMDDFTMASLPEA